MSTHPDANNGPLQFHLDNGMWKINSHVSTDPNYVLPGGAHLPAATYVVLGQGQGLMSWDGSVSSPAEIRDMAGDNVLGIPGKQIPDHAMFFSGISTMLARMQQTFPRAGVAVLPGTSALWYKDMRLVPAQGATFPASFAIEHNGALEPVTGFGWTFHPLSDLVDLSLRGGSTQAIVLGTDPVTIWTSWALSAVANVLAAAPRLEKLHVATGWGLVVHGLDMHLGTPRLDFSFPNPNPASPSVDTVHGSVVLGGEGKGSVVWRVGGLYTTHGMDSIDLVADSLLPVNLPAGASFVMREPDQQGTRVLCLGWTEGIDPAQPGLTATYYKRMDVASTPERSTTYIEGFTTPGAPEMTEFKPAVRLDTVGSSNVKPRLLAVTRALRKMIGLGFSGIAEYKSLTSGFDKIRFFAQHPVLGQVSFGLVFKKDKSDLAYVEYTKPSGYLLVPLLTETDGRGVRFDSDGTASWRSEPGAQFDDGHGFQYVMSVFTRTFRINNQDVDMSFCDWLRNHDVTADNVRVLPVERQLELFAAFLNGDRFYGVPLGASGVVMDWSGAGYTNYHTPYTYDGDGKPVVAWQQQQVIGGSSGAHWLLAANPVIP